LNALLSALVGAAAGFLAGLLADVVRASVGAVDRELERIDAIEDDAQDILIAVQRKSNVELDLRRVVRERGRLGQNLHRRLKHRRAWPSVEQNMALFARTLGAVIDASDTPPPDDGLCQSVTDRAQALRSAVRRAANESLVWRLLHRT
jgi:hypothetical protein